jgi:hypothetical protein
MKQLSVEDKIVFDLVELKKWQELEVSWNKIITVVSWKIKERLKWVLEIFNSSIYHWGDNFVAENDSLLTIFDIKELEIIKNKINVDNNFWEYCRENWSQLRDLYNVEWFEKVDLYRWDQIDKEFNWEKYKFNLWFCWADVDCLFHNQHNFVEIHTCVAGDWFMEKSLTWNNDWNDKIIETVWLMPWASHRQFNIDWEKEQNWNPKYPFHRWLWGNTGNIWLVIEKY